MSDLTEGMLYDMEPVSHATWVIKKLTLGSPRITIKSNTNSLKK